MVLVIRGPLFPVVLNTKPTIPAHVFFNPPCIRGNEQLDDAVQIECSNLMRR